MPPNSDDAIAKLTDAQRECLRLVMAGYKSKEIAHELGIGVDAVNKRLAAAKTAIGASSRFTAARHLAAFEAKEPYHSAAGSFLAVEQAAACPDPDALIRNEEWSDELPTNQHSVAESTVPYGFATQPPPIAEARAFDLALLFATPQRVFIVTALLGAVGALILRS